MTQQSQQRQEPDAYVYMLLMLAVGLVAGAAITYSATIQHGINIGTVTATEGVMTVAGEGTMVDGADGPVLVVVEQQEAATSTCTLREWTTITRDPGR